MRTIASAYMNVMYILKLLTFPDGRSSLCGVEVNIIQKKITSLAICIDRQSLAGVFVEVGIKQQSLGRRRPDDGT